MAMLKPHVVADIVSSKSCLYSKQAFIQDTTVQYLWPCFLEALCSLWHFHVRYTGFRSVTCGVSQSWSVLFPLHLGRSLVLVAETKRIPYILYYKRRAYIFSTPLYPVHILETVLIFSTNTSIQSKKKYMLDTMHAALISTKTVLIIETVLIMFRKVLTVCWY